MTKTVALLQLAERCEAASGPDLELDLLIGEAVGSWPAKPNTFRRPKRYSKSLDAAMHLVPERCKEWHCGRNIKTGKGQAYLLDPATMRSPIYIHAASPALALCAASLRALASQGNNNA